MLRYHSLGVGMSVAITPGRREILHQPDEYNSAKRFVFASPAESNSVWFTRLAALAVHPPWTTPSCSQPAYPPLTWHQGAAVLGFMRRRVCCEVGLSPSCVARIGDPANLRSLTWLAVVERARRSDHSGDGKAGSGRRRRARTMPRVLPAAAPHASRSREFVGC